MSSADDVTRSRFIFKMVNTTFESALLFDKPMFEMDDTRNGNKKKAGSYNREEGW